MPRKALIAIVAVAALTVAGRIAYAAIPDAGGVIHACYKTGNGQLRISDSGDCGPSEAPLAWNQTGPAGAPGPAGPAGPVGPPGPSGTLAWAHVAADGTVLGSSGNVTVFHFFAGGYCVGVTGGVSHAAMAVLDALSNLGGTIQTGVFHASGCPLDAHDVYVVTRPQFQDGGQPGVDRAFYLVVS